MNKKPPHAKPESSRENRILDLVAAIRAADEELQALTGGEVDSFEGRGGKAYLLQEAQEKLQQSEHRQRALAETQAAILNAVPAQIALLDKEGVILTVNSAWAHFLKSHSSSSAELPLDQNYLTICDNAAGPGSEYAHAVANGIRRVLAEELEEYVCEYPCHGPDESGWFQCLVTPIREENVAGAVVTHIDITSRKLAELRTQRLNRVYALMSEISSAIVHIRNRDELFQKCCQIAVETGGMRAAYVLLLAPGAGRVHVAASAGHVDGYFDSVMVTGDETAFGKGPFWQSMRSQKAAVCNDTESDTNFEPWREQARLRGYRSNASFPVRSGGQVLGSFALYSEQNNFFDSEEVKLLEQLVQDISFAIEFIDQNERRSRAEAGLTASEQRFRAFMENSPFAGWIVDKEGYFRYVSPGYYRMFDVGQELSGLHIRDCYEPDLADLYIKNNGLILKNQLPWEGYESGRRKDGTPGDFFVIKFPIILPNGESYVGGIALDTSERRKAEERLAEQAALLDIAHEAIMVKDLEDRIIYWNKGAERTYGWTAEEALGRKSVELLYSDTSKYEEAVAAFLAKDEWQGEMNKCHKSGRKLIVEVRWTLVRDREGRPKSILAINSDITEKKKIEAQFLRAQRMESIGTLASGIAHDLNNILAPITISIELLKASATDPESKGILEMIEGTARRGAEIVKQVLSFARGLEGERIHVMPTHLLKDMQRIVKDTFPKSIKIVVEQPETSWTIRCDPTQIHQILINLSVNARDAMPHGGTLKLRAENVEIDAHYMAMNADAKVGRYVAFSVSDTGTGISPENLDKIFEPFFTTKEIGKGTGLGLSTVLAIVKSHGGFINVYSDVGKGTTFKIYLPAENTEISSSELPEATSLPRGNGETILLVDDESSILRITGQTLHAFGYQVLMASDGAEAVGIFAQNKDDIAVVLTDIMMPIMDGNAEIRALQRIKPSVKIIAASGLGPGDEVGMSGAPNVHHFLTKPYTAETLLRTLHAVIQGD